MRSLLARTLEPQAYRSSSLCLWYRSTCKLIRRYCNKRYISVFDDSWKVLMMEVHGDGRES